MGFIEWVDAMRKKPLAERRRFSILATISVMAAIAFVWFSVFFLTLPDFTSGPQVQVAEPVFPEMPKMPQLPQLPQLSALSPALQSLLHSFGK